MKTIKINYQFSDDDLRLIQQIISNQQSHESVLLRAKVLNEFSQTKNGIVDVEKITKETGLSSTTIFNIRTNLLNNGVNVTLFRVKKNNYSFSQEDIQILKKALVEHPSNSKVYLRASVLLKLNECNMDYMTSEEIAESCNVSATTVKNIRAALSQRGLMKTLFPEKKNTVPMPTATDPFEDKLLSLIATPPDGHKRWTTRLLADKVVELGYIDSISHNSIARFIKRKNIKL